jgi:hypothetical protein
MVDPVTLPPDIPSVVFQLSVDGRMPESGAKQVGLVVADGLRASAQPIQDLVMWQGSSYPPACKHLPIRRSSAVAPSRRGDANLDHLSPSTCGRG